jgi:hypothetical protein
VGTQAFLEMVLAVSDQQVDATFGEGYWVDHWTYNLDLIESYLARLPGLPAQPALFQRRFAIL